MMAQTNSKMSTKQQLQAMKRVLGYMLRNYKFSFLIVVICILGSVLATLRGTLFMQSLIDDYIVPLTQAQTPDYTAWREHCSRWEPPMGLASSVLTAITGSW